MSRPTAENLDVMVAKSSKGAGRAELAPAWLAVKLSLLPNGTFQDGPPDCRHNNWSKKLCLSKSRYVLLYKNLRSLVIII